MGTKNNLHSSEAVEKMKELAEDAKMCMFCTKLNLPPFNSSPMTVQEVEEDGTIWFFSAADSTKNEDIRNNNDVQLIFANRGSSEYMSLYGSGEIVIDEAKAKSLWNVFLTTWFPGGPGDPNLSLIKFMPSEGYYWDAKNNKMVQSLKIAIGALRGKMMDDGVYGKMDLGS